MLFDAEGEAEALEVALELGNDFFGDLAVELEEGQLFADEVLVFEFEGEFFVVVHFLTYMLWLWLPIVMVGLYHNGCCLSRPIWRHGQDEGKGGLTPRHEGAANRKGELGLTRARFRG